MATPGRPYVDEDFPINMPIFKARSGACVAAVYGLIMGISAPVQPARVRHIMIKKNYGFILIMSCNLSFHSFIDQTCIFETKADVILFSLK